MNKAFWQNKKVLITGHTGFKGSWLSLWLLEMGAKVYGYALSPNTEPSLFELLQLEQRLDHHVGDVRDLEQFKARVCDVQPDIIIHMAAQPLVRYSYEHPVETYATNVMGTVHLYESVRACDTVKVVINVTTDKCYENKEWQWGYRENEPLGGYDPYSNSKGCSELVTSAYRNSYFNSQEFDRHGKAIASARAGNVIGGGDWSQDRLIPDIMSALLHDKKIILRNPNAIRPWQHVLEPLSGYLLLAEKLWSNPVKYSQAWNFGPYSYDAKPVSYIADYLTKQWPKQAMWQCDTAEQPHEAQYLKLDISKVINLLGWQPRWSLSQSLDSIIEWYAMFDKHENMATLCVKQIQDFSTNFDLIKE